MLETIKRAIYWAVILVFFCILFNILSGCAIVEQIGSILSPDTEQIIPTVPKEQLWQTIKGLTPNWLAIPVIALGAAAMFNGAAKLGMSCIIFGSVNLFMALATSRFGFWMALCGLIGSMAAVAASIVVKNKAVKELIFGIQEIKDTQDSAVQFPMVIKSILNKQTKTTQKLVQQIKMKAKLKGKL